MASFQRLEKMFNSGDSEVRTWFLVSSNYLPFILCAFYVFLTCSLVPAIMKNKKPFDLRIPMVLFNLGLVLTYVVSFCIIVWNMGKITMKEFCVGGSAARGTPAYTIATYFWVIYLLKYVEHLDTIFFVLRKKQNLVTFLHVLHHAIVPILGWILFRTEKSGVFFIPVLINSFVHIVMYSYYGLAAIGPRVRKYLYWKKYITQLQMCQFILIMLYVAALPISGCTVLQSSFMMAAINGPLFLYLFYRFYVSTFGQEQESRITIKATTNGESKNGVAKRETPATTNGESRNGVAKLETPASKKGD